MNIGRLSISTTTQPGGSPLIDRSSTWVKYLDRNMRPVAHRAGTGRTIRLPFLGRRPTRAVSVAWLQPYYVPDPGGYR